MTTNASGGRPNASANDTAASMSTATMREAVAICEGRAKLEASGNVTLDNVLEVAGTGVDYISVGALTHSPAVFDVSLEYVA